MEAVSMQLDNIPNELLVHLVRRVGVKDALQTLPHNSNLHKAWQLAAEKASIPISCLDHSDATVLKKFINLKTLCLQDADGSFATDTNGLANMIKSIIRVLVHLRSLSMDRIKGCFAVVKQMSASPDAFANLHTLKLMDDRHTLLMSDLQALAQLKTISTLVIACCKIAAGAPMQQLFLRDACRNLSQLQDLRLTTRDPIPANIIATLPGSLTCLTSLGLFFRCDTACSRAAEAARLGKALSSLTNLRALGTNHCAGDAAAQQRGLAKLAQLVQLTQLLLGADDDPTSEEMRHLAVLADLPELVELRCPNYVVHDPCSHTALQRLHAFSVQVGAQWRGKAADACRIQELVLIQGDDDDDEDEDEDEGEGEAGDECLRNLPLLPRLSSFKCMLGGADSYPHLQGLLERQAGTLEQVELKLWGAYHGSLPQELPVCRVLELKAAALDLPGMKLWAGCRLPRLQVLRAALELSDVGVQEEDVAWLRKLPALRQLRVSVSGSGAAGFKELVVGLMQGCGVDVSIVLV